MKNRERIASQCTLEVTRGYPAPCFSPDFSSDNELYEKFGGLNDIAIAQDNVQYKDIIGVRLQPVDTIPSMYEGLDDNVIMDNVLPKHISINDIYHEARFYADKVHEENNKSD